MKRRLHRLGVDTSHFGGRKSILGHAGRGRPPESYLTQGSKITSTLKMKLLRLGVLRAECYKCHIGPEWNGEPLMLQLDHIDGNPFNSVLENLRILCPNCHTQTHTFAGRNLGKQK